MIWHCINKSELNWTRLDLHILLFPYPETIIQGVSDSTVPGDSKSAALSCAADLGVYSPTLPVSGKVNIGYDWQCSPQDTLRQLHTSVQWSHYIPFISKSRFEDISSVTDGSMRFNILKITLGNCIKVHQSLARVSWPILFSNLLLFSTGKSLSMTFSNNIHTYVLVTLMKICLHDGMRINYYFKCAIVTWLRVHPCFSFPGTPPVV